MELTHLQTELLKNDNRNSYTYIVVFVIIVAYSFDECSYNNKYLDGKIEHEMKKQENEKDISHRI